MGTTRVPRKAQHGSGKGDHLRANPQHLDPRKHKAHEPPNTTGPHTTFHTTGHTARKRPRQNTDIEAGLRIRYNTHTQQKQIETTKEHRHYTMAREKRKSRPWVRDAGKETENRKTVSSPARPEVGKPAPHPYRPHRRNTPSKKKQKQTSSTRTNSN